MNYLSGKPILFHPLKHHLGFIKAFCSQKSPLQTGLSGLNTELKSIGQSVLDMYTGSLAVVEIENEIVQALKCQNIFEKNSFVHFVEQQNGKYICLKLSDNSSWIIRIAQNDDYYLHVHPGRKSLFSMRINAITLKTAIGFVLFSKTINFLDNRDLVNFVRRELLIGPTISGKFPLNSVFRLVKLLTYNEFC